MLKMKLTKEEFDAVKPEVQAEYKLQGDLYVLDLEGYEDAGELRRARDREKLEAKAEKERADKLQKAIDDAKEAGARNSGDIAALEKSWKEKSDAMLAEKDAKLKKKDSWAQKTLVQSVAEGMAAQLSDYPKLLVPHLKTRLSADLASDDPATVVLDANGQRSALTVAELAQEFRTNPEFAAIMRGSKATGAGGGGGQGNGAPKKPSEMNDAERIALRKDNPAKFNELFGNTQFGA